MPLGVIFSSDGVSDRLMMASSAPSFGMEVGCHPAPREFVGWERVSAVPPMTRGGGAKTAASPSVKIVPLHGGPTQTATGRPSRPKTRAAKDGEEIDRRQLVAVGRDVRQRMVVAIALADAVHVLSLVELVVNRCSTSAS